MRTRYAMLIISLAGLAAVVTAPPYGHALMIQKPLEELVVESTSIIVGRVTDVKSQWDSEGTVIHTYVTVAVDNAVKGPPGRREEVIRLPGGIVGEIGLKVEDVPTFSKGEEVILFLRPQYPRVVGLSQGKYSLRRDKVSGKKLVISEREKVFDRKQMAIREFAEKRIPLEDFLARITAIMKAQQRPKP